MLSCIFGQRAPYSILSSMCKRITNAGTKNNKKTKKKNKSVNIIFSALLVISENELHDIITLSWTVSLKFQQVLMLKVTRSDPRFTFQVISCTGSNMHEPLKHIMKTKRVYIFYKQN